MHSDPQALAELAGKTMYERDPASQALVPHAVAILAGGCGLPAGGAG